MAGRYEPLKSDSLGNNAQNLKPRGTVARRLGIGFAIVLTLATLSVIRIHPSSLSADLGLKSSSNVDSSSDNSAVKTCAPASAPIAHPPAPINPWASLSLDETVQVQKWLEHPKRNLNLTRGDIAQPSDNHIYMIEAYYPSKADVFGYFSSLDPAAIPSRNARITIHHGSADKPMVKDYLVGPLPISSTTRMKPLTDIYHTEDIPFNARGFDARDWTVPQFFSKMAAPLAEAFKDLLGGIVAGLPNDTLITGGSGPFSFDGSFRRLWIGWRRNTPGFFLHPLNLYQYIDVSGTDPSKWEQLKVVYNHQVFDTSESFMEAFHNGSLQRIAPVTEKDADLSWSTRKRIGAQRDLDHLPGPRSISSSGLRFRVDRDLQYVSWMGWGLYLGFNRDMGLSLWDIRFRDERIVYELAPQEAIAQYTGNDPFQSTTAWLDRYFGMGLSVRDMIPGYDCPHEAVYLPATTFATKGIFTRERGICVFEHDSGRPLTRHLGYGENEFGAVKGYELVIRSISTVGNYDYLVSFDYIFHLDGTIEVRLSASGYLQAGFYDAEQGHYGNRIWETTIGSLHDHVINFKVDLDVAGTSNSLLKITTSQEIITQPWYEDDWGDEVIQQKITREYIDNEDDALLRFPTNFQGSFAVVNQNETNKWGVPRGYAIHPGYSPVHNTIVGSKRLLNNANWARYNLAVSRRKETEPSSSSMWNFNLPGAPPVDFHKFFDGESIAQEDLVAWVNVGMHHLPQAEDAPNTRTNTAASSFFLTPVNYFDYDVSIESTNAILLQSPEKPGDPFSHDDYGVRPAHCIPEPVAPFEYFPVQIFDLDGKRAPPATVEEMRRAAELYHRIKMEL
ncbi:amine oxidase catalytic domain-containing protein [Leucogyrophana mollusca]|uniref:Amine oxidase catalytic domain-containing protein n=1 Tax=Leucogyrophana mollusca TaxID=85980 RepID=A0ACB8BMI8_9AGAM|nr:amine oxidase catalytic domain-containing protein [Leucogyrophana mollusca]